MNRSILPVPNKFIHYPYFACRQLKYCLPATRPEHEANKTKNVRQLSECSVACTDIGGNMYRNAAQTDAPNQLITHVIELGDKTVEETIKNCLDGQSIHIRNIMIRHI